MEFIDHLTIKRHTMQFVKQPVTLQFDDFNIDSERRSSRHSELLPNTIRCIICGPSNCGKTNLMIGLLLHKHGLQFRNVYVYSKTLYQPKYKFLEHVLKMVPNVKFFKFHENEEVLPPETAKCNSIIIFDDVACENQSSMRNYFAMGRHKDIDCFYLNQTYSKIPKQLVRDNANLIVVFKQDDINMKHIYNEHVNTDISWHEFRNMCSNIWKEPYSYLVINKDCEKSNGCYRKNFDTFVVFH